MFWVINKDDNTTSWSAKDDCAEQFDTKAKAIKRAKELADMEPGVVFAVVHAGAEVVCPVSKPEVREL